MWINRYYMIHSCVKMRSPKKHVPTSSKQFLLKSHYYNYTSLTGFEVTVISCSSSHFSEAAF